MLCKTLLWEAKLKSKNFSGVTVIGGGLAGCEAAFPIKSSKNSVQLIEM